MNLSSELFHIRRLSQPDLSQINVNGSSENGNGEEARKSTVEIFINDQR